MLLWPWGLLHRCGKPTLSLDPQGPATLVVPLFTKATLSVLWNHFTVQCVTTVSPPRPTTDQGRTTVCFPQTCLIDYSLNWCLQWGEICQRQCKEDQSQWSGQRCETGAKAYFVLSNINLSHTWHDTLAFQWETGRKAGSVCHRNVPRNPHHKSE